MQLLYAIKNILVTLADHKCDLKIWVIFHISHMFSIKIFIKKLMPYRYYIIHYIYCQYHFTHISLENFENNTLALTSSFSSKILNMNPCHEPTDLVWHQHEKYLFKTPRFSHTSCKCLSNIDSQSDKSRKQFSSRYGNYISAQRTWTTFGRCRGTDCSENLEQ